MINERLFWEGVPFAAPCINWKDADKPDLRGLNLKIRSCIPQQGLATQDAECQCFQCCKSGLASQGNQAHGHEKAGRRSSGLGYARGRRHGSQSTSQHLGESPVTRLILLCLFVGLAACSTANRIEYLPGPLATGQTLQPVFFVTNRVEPLETFLGKRYRSLGGERGKTLQFARADLSIPPVHEPGQIEWATPGNPDPNRHFVVRDGEEFQSQSDFMRAVRNAAPGGDPQVIVYVHGYNTNIARVVYRVAQIAHDYGEEVPVIAFSWPSAGTLGGYVYDRDSMIYSRDDLEALLVMLDREGRDIVLVGHSMGTQLVMETLRQMSIGENRAVLRDLELVALLSPDIDVEVFRRQAARVTPFPDDFYIFVSEEDEALSFSALLTGAPRRLGSIKDSAELADLPVTVFELEDFSTSGDLLGHDLTATSPEVIAMINALFADGI